MIDLLIEVGIARPVKQLTSVQKTCWNYLQTHGTRCSKTGLRSWKMGPRKRVPDPWHGYFMLENRYQIIENGLNPQKWVCENRSQILEMTKTSAWCLKMGARKQVAVWQILEMMKRGCSKTEAWCSQTGAWCSKTGTTLLKMLRYCGGRWHPSSRHRRSLALVT